MRMVSADHGLAGDLKFIVFAYSAIVLDCGIVVYGLLSP